MIHHLRLFCLYIAARGFGRLSLGAFLAHIGQDTKFADDPTGLVTQGMQRALKAVQISICCAQAENPFLARTIGTRLQGLRR
jgi:hypothetical protein